VRWLFQRENDAMRLRTAYDNATKQFVATLAGFDGNEDHVRFDSAEAFRTWLQALEERLEREQRTAADDLVVP
jgi:hypothetical protein